MPKKGSKIDFETNLPTQKKPAKKRAPFIFGTAFFPAHFSYSPVIACVGEPIFWGAQKIGQEPSAPKKGEERKSR